MASTRPRPCTSVDYLAESLGYVLAKRASAPVGTTLVLRVEGHAPMAFTVDESGRGRRLDDVPDEPTAALAMDRESFVVAAGGRREPEPGRVVVTGDAALAQRVLERLAVTP